MRAASIARVQHLTPLLAVFAAIAWVWRPTGSNARLSMSDELAQDDDLDAEDFEIDGAALTLRQRILTGADPNPPTQSSVRITTERRTRRRGVLGRKVEPARRRPLRRPLAQE